MPTTVAGRARTTNTDPRDKHEAQLDYRPLGMIMVSGERKTRDTASGKKELLSANNLLAVNFGLGLACAKGSYRGTAPHPTYRGGGPGVTDTPLTKPVWFSCRVDGAEGVETYTGRAVGWTSGKTAWLVVVHDTAAARSLTTALRRSAQ